MTMIPLKVDKMWQRDILGKYGQGKYPVASFNKLIINLFTISIIPKPYWITAQKYFNLFRPRGIERVFKNLPDSFHVTDSDIAGLLPNGSTIQTEIEKGRIFIVDNSIMGSGVHFIRISFTIDKIE